MLHVAEEEDDLAVGDDGHVVVGYGLGLVGELGVFEVPEDVDGGVTEVEALGTEAAPEVPWAHLDLAGGEMGAAAAAFAVGGGFGRFDGDVEAEGEEILAPSDGDEAGVASDEGAV